MKKFVSIALVILLAFTLFACSDNNGSDNSSEGNNGSAIDALNTGKITVDTTGMTAKEVSIVAHVYFDMYATREAFFGAGESDIGKLSQAMVEYLNTQKVENAILAGYIQDFKNVYAEIIKYAKEPENKDLKTSVEKAMLKATNNVTPIRGICDKFDVQYVYFYREEIDKENIHFTFSDIKRSVIKDDAGDPSDEVLLSLKVSAQNRASIPVYGTDLIYFDLYDLAGNRYALTEDHIRARTMLDGIIGTGRKAKATIAFTIPEDLQLYILVQDTSTWSTKGGYIRLASYSMF